MQIISHPLSEKEESKPEEDEQLLSPSVLEEISACSLKNQEKDFCETQDLLLLHIETTSLRPQTGKVYLIGCLYYRNDTWNRIQWFDESGLEEAAVLSSFQIFARDFRYILTYGGNRFDVPFIKGRLEACGLPQADTPPVHIDLYPAVKPYRNAAGLTDLRLETLTRAFGNEIPPRISGRDKIRKYHQYLANPVPGFLDLLLSQNVQTLIGIRTVLPVILFSSLPDLKLTAERAQADDYERADGTKGQELFLFVVCSPALPLSLEASFDGCYMKLEGERGLFKIPMYDEDMKYFYASYRDYYYLPAEDMAIHKSIASYVDKNHRVPARPETCYTRKNATFLPQWDLFRTPFFKREFDSEQLFFEFTPDCRRSRTFLSAYAAYILKTILSHL